MTPEAWRAALDSRLRDHLADSYARAPAVRALLDGAALEPRAVRGVADLRAIPVTSKDELVRRQADDPPFGGFCAVPLDQVSRIFVSPGPLYEPDNLAGDRFPLTWLLRLFEMHGVPRTGPALVSFSYHLVPAGLGFDESLRRYGLTVVPGGVGQTDVQARALRDLGVVLIGATPSFAVAVCERAEALGAKWGHDLRLRFAVVGAEAFTVPLQAEIARRGIAVIETYGTADVGLLGATCPEAVGFHLTDEAVVEVVDPETREPLATGEVGEIVVTSFNRVYPLVRLGTGDLAALQAGPCACGLPSPVLSRLAGRVGQAVKVRGMFLWPHQVDAAFEGLGGIGRYQAAVRRSGRRDELVLRVESDRDGDGDGTFAERLRRRARELWRVRPDRVETVPFGTLPEGGKVLVDERPWDL